MGFGVALTGSSCYHLNNMETDARRNFLEGIYDENDLRLYVRHVMIGSNACSVEICSGDNVDSLEKASGAACC